jgi:hypothetical protein
MGYEWSVEKLKEFWDHTTWSISNQSINQSIPLSEETLTYLLQFTRPCNHFGRQQVTIHSCM